MSAELQRQAVADVNNNNNPTTANVSDATTVSTTSGLLQLDTENWNLGKKIKKIIN